jgi:hypothetical protein
MNVQELGSDVQISSAIDATASGGTALAGTVDMQGYDGVMFIVPMHVANAGNFIKAGQGDAANGSDAVDLEGSKVTPLANLDLAILDIYRPRRGTLGPRYVTCHVVRAGADTAIGGCIAIRYHSAKKPPVNTVAGQSIYKLLTSPAEGTA